MVYKGAKPKYKLRLMECHKCNHEWEQLDEVLFGINVNCPECNSHYTNEKIATATHHQHVSWGKWKAGE